MSERARDDRAADCKHKNASPWRPSIILNVLVRDCPDCGGNDVRDAVSLTYGHRDGCACNSCDLKRAVLATMRHKPECICAECSFIAEVATADANDEKQRGEEPQKEK
jgi:hypothetical protein